VEGISVKERLSNTQQQLTDVENTLAKLVPVTEAAKQKVQEIFAIRDTVRKGLDLLAQRGSLAIRREELAAMKPASKSEKPKLGITSTAAYDFAQTVSSVLEEWQFPGKRHVSFEEKTYDLRIDGKNRSDNGKGIRAITHAAFKVALLLYCHERKLPHPGFVVMDTPLLTYRDPMKSRAGPLSPDEQSLGNTSLKEFFFEHLARNADKGQFIVIENVDLPPGIEGSARIETFTGDPGTGRAGFFPAS
jgi:hypothetical protein